MKEELIIKIGKFLERHPELKGLPATQEEIAMAESRLEIKLDADYKTFIKRFGGFHAGVTVHAFNNGSTMGNESIIDLTVWSRKSFRESEVLPEINDCMVFSDDGTGNPIALNSKGEVIVFFHDTLETEVLSKSFVEFIESNFSDW